MAQLVRCLPLNLSSIPGTHGVERNNFHKLSSDFDTYAITHIHTHTVVLVRILGDRMLRDT